MNEPKPKAPFRVKFIIAFTIMTTIFWVGFDVYRAVTTKPVPIVPPEILSPITPNLDESVLNTLPNRVYLENTQ